MNEGIRLLVNVRMIMVNKGITIVSIFIGGILVIASIEMRGIMVKYGIKILPT